MALSGISVVLCCAGQDEPHLSAVVEHLRRESIEPVVLGGMDEDAHRLGAAVDAERGRALFVLCKSRALTQSHVMRLEGIFGARKGPSHRLITARLSPDDALGMVKDIRAALGGFSASRSSFEDSDDDGGPLREVVNISGISAVGSDARSVASVRERMSSRETPADPLAIPMRGTKTGELAARVPAHQSGAWQTKLDPGETLSEKKSPLAQLESGEGPRPASLLPEPTPPRSNMLLPALVGGLLVAVLGVGALLVMRGPAPADAPVARQPPAPMPTPAPQPAVMPARPEPAPDPAREPMVGETGEEAAQETGAAEESPSGRTPSEDAAISEAIANGDMRALDLLLVLSPADARPWPKAVDHCRATRINGVGGWRLPTLPELKKLRAVRMLKAGRYWSSTRPAGQTGEAYILDRNTRRVEMVAKDAEDVLVLCVRTR